MCSHVLRVYSQVLHALPCIAMYSHVLKYLPQIKWETRWSGYQQLQYLTQ